MGYDVAQLQLHYQVHQHKRFYPSGRSFTSSQFTSFCRSRGILHIRMPPLHPRSKGQAECFVDTFKRGLAKLKREGQPTVDALQTFLMV
ncbi:hypothetical protein RB195_024713 [Necator americanus]|uniref:Integrase catalytic domain-containing protein n=1 Tax=Necator americanus TaxID=51031 RepID=A0ABR1EPV8_NECAM